MTTNSQHLGSYIFNILKCIPIYIKGVGMNIREILREHHKVLSSLGWHFMSGKNEYCNHINKLDRHDAKLSIVLQLGTVTSCSMITSPYYWIFYYWIDFHWRWWDSFVLLRAIFDQKLTVENSGFSCSGDVCMGHNLTKRPYGCQNS